jgi:regulator of nonsense transcripts 2
MVCHEGNNPNAEEAEDNRPTFDHNNSQGTSSESSTDSSVSDEEESETEELIPVGPTAAEEDAFGLQFQSLMSESLHSRRNERAVNIDFSVPVLQRSDMAGSSSAPNTSSFSLLTKRSNKVELKTIEVPSDAKMVSLTKARQEESRQEQKHIKKLILDYEVRNRDQQ